MTYIEVTASQLLTALEHMPADELDAFVAQALALRAQREAPRLPISEADILLQINRGLAPSLQKRFTELLAKRDQSVLSQTEYAELIQLTDTIEHYDADRVSALSQLAAIRHLSVTQLMDDLAIEPPSWNSR